MSSESVANDKPAVKRVGGLKVVVKSKKRKRAQQRTTSRGLPTNRLPTTNASTQQQDAFPVIQEEEIPCDTLLAMQSIEQARACLDVPLCLGGSIPCVLESQLRQRLNDNDSLVDRELQQLAQSGKIRRLTSASNDQHAIEAVIETRHYKRAVWDAHRKYGNDASPDITGGFLECLAKVTKRRISVNDLQSNWPKSTTWNEKVVVDTLVKMHVLLPVNDSFILWLPLWGLVLKQLSKAQQKVMSQLKRSLYKELSKSQVERMHHTGLSGQFVLHTLVSHGLVDLQERPSGTFVRLCKSTS